MEVSGQLHAPAALQSGKRGPGTHRIGDWVGSSAGLEIDHDHFRILPSSSSGHEVRPINDLFRTHNCIRLVVSLIVVQVFGLCPTNMI
jgi:hypothetical protein